MTKRKKIGLSPGSLIYTGERKDKAPIISGVKYDQKNITSLNHEECLNLDLNPEFLYWMDIRGVHDVDLITTIGNRFSIDKLIRTKS